MELDLESITKKMIEEQLCARGIRSADVLDAMRSVPRHLFVPENLKDHAYEDSPLPIGFGQTISQPYIVAFMTEQLNPVTGMKILEIGTGSGYQAAVLAHLGCKVFSVELLEELVNAASRTLSDLHYENVKIRHGSGYEGWQEEAPFDAVIVTSAPTAVPEALIGQLKDGGKMIVPVGGTYSVQWLKLVVKKDGQTDERDLLPVRFVPMV